MRALLSCSTLQLKMMDVLVRKLIIRVTWFWQANEDLVLKVMIKSLKVNFPW
jgi:hypothetical protein